MILVLTDCRKSKILNEKLLAVLDLWINNYNEVTQSVKLANEETINITEQSFGGLGNRWKLESSENFTSLAYLTSNAFNTISRAESVRVVRGLFIVMSVTTDK